VPRTHWDGFTDPEHACHIQYARWGPTDLYEATCCCWLSIDDCPVDDYRFLLGSVIISGSGSVFLECISFPANVANCQERVESKTSERFRRRANQHTHTEVGRE
jgi:hypothetical protein